MSQKVQPFSLFIAVIVIDETVRFIESLAGGPWNIFVRSTSDLSSLYVSQHIDGLGLLDVKHLYPIDVIWGTSYCRKHHSFLATTNWYTGVSVALPALLVALDTVELLLIDLTMVNLTVSNLSNDDIFIPMFPWCFVFVNVCTKFRL